MDEEINALCIRFLNNFWVFLLLSVFFCFCFFFQRKHTHNVASQYLLSCRPACRAAGRTEQPRRRVEREIEDGRGGRNYGDLKTDFNEGKGTELSAP